MEDDQRLKRRKLMDSVYGAPSPGEQNYFARGGMGPPTEGMLHQQHASPDESHAFDHPQPGPSKDDMWFIDQVDMDAGQAMVQQGDRTMTVPLDLLPKGAREGASFDPESGELVTMGREPQRRPMPDGDEDDMRNLKL